MSDANTAPQREMPRYKSHKVVWALKIKEIQIQPANGHLLIPADAGYGPVRITDEYYQKHHPQAEGYYVVYQDGYQSYSPAEAFEGGYTPFDATMADAMAEKTLHNSDIDGAKKNVPDIKVVGNGDMFQLLCKASSQNEGWMKSTKACEIKHVGCIVQVTTQQRNEDGSYAVAEAVTFVPGVKIEGDDNNGRRLVSDTYSD